MKRRKPIALAVGVPVLLMSASAFAAEPVRVVILADSAHESMRIHVVEELLSLGFAVSTPPIPPDATDAAVIAARNYEPVGVLVIEHGDIEVWIVGEEGVPVLSEVVGARVAEHQREGVLHAVERLRASLLKIGVKLAPEPDPSTPAPPAPIPASEATLPIHRPNNVRLILGGSAVSSRGGVGSTGHAQLGLRWTLGPTWGLHGFGMPPVVNATLEAEQGSAFFSPALVGAGMWSTVGPSRWVEPAVEAGIAAVFVDTLGQGADGFQGRHDANVVALPYVGLGLRVPVAESWGLRADMLGGSSVPRTKVLYAGREVAMWGSLVFAGSASVELVLF